MDSDQTLSSASFRFVNEFDRVDNEDSIHEMDLVQLLNIGFELRRINAKIIGVCTNAVSVACSIDRCNVMNSQLTITFSVSYSTVV